MISARMVSVIDFAKIAADTSEKVKNKIARIACMKAGAVAKAAIISAAPSRTGALQQSIRIRVRNYQNRDIWMVIVGPSMKFQRSLVRATKNREGKSGSHFMEKAGSSVQQDVIEVMQDKIQEQLSQISN